jgi:hypothetical protein
MNFNKPFAEEIQTTELCEYGCGQPAKYRFRKGKVCCSKHFNSCYGKKKAFSESQDHKANAAKSLETRTELGITKSSQIKGAKTRKENGHYEKLAKTMQKHWEERPWNNLPKWGIYKDTDIKYQSRPEYNFLEELEDEHGLDWVRDNVKRGPCFYYNDPTSGKERLYISDFQIENTVFEVKGNYTWNRHGKDNGLEETNKAKLDKVKESSYNVILVLEGKRIKI